MIYVYNLKLICVWLAAVVDHNNHLLQNEHWYKFFIPYSGVFLYQVI